MSDTDRQRNLNEMAAAADRAGGFVKIVEQLQKQEEVEIKVGLDKCGVRGLQKGDTTVVRRVGSHQLHRGDVVLYRSGHGLRYGRLLRVVVEQEGRYLEVRNDEKADATLRLKPSSVAGKVIRASRGGVSVALGWSLMDDLKERFGPKSAAEREQ
ncbi:MAG: hypothetical protein ACYCW6_29970 [Candidatus Xenobia bacterium]